MANETVVTEFNNDGTPGKQTLSKEENGEQKKLDIDQPDLQIEVIDDTPAQDRHRPIKATKKETEKEVDQYSESVKKRINELKFDYHTERRAKEAFARERDEAVRVAKLAHTELQEIKKRQVGEYEEYKKQLQAKAEGELKAAKLALERAYEEGDKKAIAQAQEEISVAAVNREVANRFTPPKQEVLQNNTSNDKKEDVQQQQRGTQQEIPPDPEATEWGKNNPWFGDDDEMTSFAFGVHEKLIKTGVDPVKGAEEYYKRIDARMREKFPEYEWGDETPKPTPKRESKVATVVAPVQRTSKGTKVTLTATQAQLAKRLGITPEQYARELIKEQERANG